MIGSCVKTSLVPCRLSLAAARQVHATGRQFLISRDVIMGLAEVESRLPRQGLHCHGSHGRGQSTVLEADVINSRRGHDRDMLMCLISNNCDHLK